MGSVSLRAPSAASSGARGADLWLKPSYHPSAAPGGRPKAQSAVLVVGARDPLLTPLTEALVRHGMFVESTSAADVIQAVIAGAPDLVLLADDAIRDGGVEVIARLAASPLSSVIPIAVLAEDTGLEARLTAFRHGVTAVVRRSASVDAIAMEIAALVRSSPERPEVGLGDIGEITLDELVATLAQELRSGILSVRTKGAEGPEPVRIVLGGGRPVSAIIDEFVRRMERHVVAAEPLVYEFDERAGGTVALLDVGADPEDRPAADLGGLRVLLADDQSGRADAIAQELRGHHAIVAVTDLDPGSRQLARVRELDPAVLLIGEEHLQGDGYALIQVMRADLRLRWASLLVVPWREVWPDDAAAPSLAGLFSQLASLGDIERTIQRWTGEGRPFELRLEATGPARMLRALADSGRSLRATVQNARALVTFDVSDGIVVGASAETMGEGAPTLQGALALSALMMLSSGRVRVEHVAQPAVANLMSTPEVALNMATAESPPIAPSIPAPPRVPAELAPGLPAPALPVAALVAAGAIVLVGVAAVVAAVALGGSGRRGGAADVGAGATSIAVAPAARPAPPARPSPSGAQTAMDAATPATGAELISDATKVAAGERCRKAAAEVQGGIGSELRSANRAMLRGDLDDAERWYCVAVDRYPKDPDALTGIIRLQLLRRNAAAALFFAEHAVRERPGDFRMLAFLGDAHALAEQSEPARQALAKAAGIDPRDSAALTTLDRRYRAVAYGAFDEKRFGEAERYFRRSAALQPENVDTAMGLARALAAQGQRDAAFTWAERAVALGPRNAKAHLALGDVRLRAGDKVGAAQAWKDALELDPNNPEVRFRFTSLSGK